VTTVEIREINPPRDIQDAMNRQMSAERNRRATVTEADGRREAAVMVADGQKQAAILEAEGHARALETVFGAAQLIDSKTMTIQVIDGLKALGASPGSTFVIPMEFTRLLGQVGTYLEQSLGTGTASNGRRRSTEPRLVTPLAEPAEPGH
jgi:regulator of protease activity HflC (stomatin/prohibitin superfamily)